MEPKCDQGVTVSVFFLFFLRAPYPYSSLLGRPPPTKLSGLGSLITEFIIIWGVPLLTLSPVIVPVMDSVVLLSCGVCRVSCRRWGFEPGRLGCVVQPSPINQFDLWIT